MVTVQKIDGCDVERVEREVMDHGWSPVGSLSDGTQGGGIPDGEREVSGVVLCNAPRGQGIFD